MMIAGTAYWAFLNKKNEMAGKYTLDVGQLDAATVKELKDNGLNVRTKESKEGQPDRGQFITLKGVYPPKIVDSQLNPIPRDTLIGNGSLVRVTGKPFSGNNKFGDYTVFSWKTVQIVELVEYSGGGDDDEIEATDGYVTTATDDAELSDSPII